MNQETKDQAWRKIESNIDQLVCKFLGDNCPAIEYKTRINGFLESPPEYNKQAVEEES
ncbi:MAG TPA: hypothetical protein PKZ12_00815 [Smithellaceae bacterium]|nr:hypothetical protein [Smithellaceae bacterium]